MNINKMILQLIAFIIYLLPCYAYASLTPTATTLSNQTITATIDGSTLLYGEVTILTNTVAIALSTSPDQLDYPAIHSAQASALALSPIDSNTIATFISSHYTSAQASYSTPLFAKSASVSQINLNAVISPSVAANLNINWTFDDLSIKAAPTSSFAYMSDLIQVFQQTTSGIE